MAGAKQRILFSALGKTDPVRGFHDGACLHIVRHYHPQRVILFFTEEMAEKENADHRYTRAIRRLAPEVAIEEIFSGIEDVHLYDTFARILPETIYALSETYKDTEILLNLSSGTPQIKTALAMLAADIPNCLGVQVASPEKRANRERPIDEEDIETVLETNLDDEEGAENRCSEPPLALFRYQSERSRIISLADAFEYRAALRLAEKSRGVPTESLNLLRHAAKRADLLTQEAKNTLARYDGRHLFPFKGKAEILVEYFLVMQMDQQCGRLSNLLVRVIPFLYEFLLAYDKLNMKRPLQNICQKKSGQHHFYLTRECLRESEPKFLVYLDSKLLPGFRDSDLSFHLLYQYCDYAKTEQTAKNGALHEKMMELLAKVKSVNQLRNGAAHEIMNVTEDAFRERLGMTSAEMMNVFFAMLRLIYGENVGHLRGIYRELNRWIDKSLEVPEL